MIHYQTGNLFDSDAEALINTVNTVGVMGKGIALQFKNLFPLNFQLYSEVCKSKELVPGKLFIVEDSSLHTGSKLIINFPTKTHWRYPSEYEYIEQGLEQLVRVIEERRIKSLALPPLGAGNGGLEWRKVKLLIEKYLGNSSCEIYVYEPSAAIQEILKKERVILTPARAMLLSVLFELPKNGEFVSEFAAEKIAYFLQRFGAKSHFQLEFTPYFYGPYSGKVKHVLNYLNGSYITGFSANDKKPFEELGLIPDAEKDVEDYLSQSADKSLPEIVDKTKAFLSGYYTPYGLELLSTVDFILKERGVFTEEAVSAEMSRWSNRKKTMFTQPGFIANAIVHLQAHLSY
ncbi:MAG: macro domain-containing protein [Bacteroidia bacterium]|jgi:O-acetyl-ADP-ribose deacetylase (regulator of RNase III)|nr:macro domain-containing protein [Bacteroidia bacterium]